LTGVSVLRPVNNFWAKSLKKCGFESKTWLWFQSLVVSQDKQKLHTTYTVIIQPPLLYKTVVSGSHFFQRVALRCRTGGQSGISGYEPIEHDELKLLLHSQIVIEAYL
jgi:hypothetical protein